MAVAPDVAAVGPSLDKPLVEQDAGNVPPVPQQDVDERAAIWIVAPARPDAVAAGEQLPQAIARSDGEPALVLARGLRQLRRVDGHEAPFLAVVAPGIAVDEAARQRPAVAERDGAVTLLADRLVEAMPGGRGDGGEAGDANGDGELPPLP